MVRNSNFENVRINSFIHVDKFEKYYLPEVIPPMPPTWRSHDFIKCYDRQMTRRYIENGYEKEEIVENPLWFGNRTTELPGELIQRLLAFKVQFLEDNSEWYDYTFTYMKGERSWDSEKYEILRFFTEDEVWKILDITPFTPCVYMTISPNWKGCPINHRMIKDFRTIIDSYGSSCNRYSRWSYVLECGSEGDFLHAHCVFEINKTMLNSVLNGKNSHIKKGRHIGDIRKWWKKIMNPITPDPKSELGPEGIGGCLKGKFAVHTTIIRNENLYKDKMSYLQEELKPEDHKNAPHDLLPILIQGMEGI
jgi:hypothetical protein